MATNNGYANGIVEKTPDTASGTGDLTLSGLGGFRSFNDEWSTGGTDVFKYYIRDKQNGDMEFGTGHLVDSTTLSRDTVLWSTNGNNLVDFSSGVKIITQEPAIDSNGNFLIDADTLEGKSLFQVRNHIPDSHGQSQHNSGSVGQNELKTSTGSVSGSFSSGTFDNISLNAYSVFPDIEADQTNVNMNPASSNASASPDSPQFRINAFSNTTVNYDVAWRYVQSSPPYNLGDGQVGAFIYLNMNQDGSIKDVWISEDPPWYGIGTHFVDGELHYVDLSGTSFDNVEKGKLTLKEWKNQLSKDYVPLSEDPHRYKERRPKPFPGSNNVVILDPACDLCHELIEIHKNMIAVPEEPNLTAVLSNGYFEVKNDVTDKRETSIPGVSIVEGAIK